MIEFSSQCVVKPVTNKGQSINLTDSSFVYFYITVDSQQPNDTITTNNNNKNQEARCLSRCQRARIDTPTVYMVDTENYLIYMEYIEGCSVREYLVTPEGQTEAAQTKVAQEIGRALGLMHNIDVVHGDLTTSNLLMRNETGGSVVLIDFGLSYVSQLIEDKAVDLYVLERAFSSTHPNTEVMVG